MRTSRMFKNQFVSAFSVVALALVLPGCSDSDGGGNPVGGGGGDTTPPGIAGIAATDMFHINVMFNEDVQKESAERNGNYLIIERAAPPSSGGTYTPAPNDTTHVGSAVLNTDNRTVTLTTISPMTNAPYDLKVNGVKDLNGNQLTSQISQSFTGANTTDQTSPTIVFRNPSPGSIGIGVGQPIRVQFNEVMAFNTIFPAFTLTYSGGQVATVMNELGDNEYVFTPLQLLELNTTYTVAFSGSATDFSGNPLMPVAWTFKTTPDADMTPPTLISSTPADGAVNVSVDTDLQLVFSEAIDQTSLDEVLITPDVGDGVPVWSNGGTTVTFDPDMPLMMDTKYTFVIPEGSIRDLSGNNMQSTVSFDFTTGSSFANGAFSGTVSGDPTSLDATNPMGAIVVAPTDTPFGDDDDLQIGGVTVVGVGGIFSITKLEDDVYYPFSILDSNNDDDLDPGTGDAVGAFGVDFSGGSPSSPDSVTISGGNTVLNVDFQLYDFSAIVGIATYSGTSYTNIGAQIYIAAFDTTGFDTTGGIPTPDYETDAFYPNGVDYAFSEIDGEIAPGVYYVAAYMDVGFNSMYDPDTDPLAFYEVGGQWAAVEIQGGRDALGIDIYMMDPPSSGSSWQPVNWGAPKKPTSASASTPRQRAAAHIRGVLKAYEDSKKR